MTEPEILETPVTEEAPVAQPVVNPAEIPEKQENMFTGIIGALLGAAIGGASIVLLGQLGYVASISGLILAVCTLKGYELLGKSRGTVGTILCVLLMLITPYIAYRISFAMQLVSIFAGLGVEIFGNSGDVFDPNIHNAVMHTEDPELGENVISQVFQKGFKLGDKIVRFAMVQVAN